MKVSINRQIYIATLPGPLMDLNDVTFCPDEATANKVAEEEYDMTGQKMLVLPVQIAIPVDLVGGQLIITENK